MRIEVLPTDLDKVTVVLSAQLRPSDLIHQKVITLWSFSKELTYQNQSGPVTGHTTKMLHELQAEIWFSEHGCP